MICNAELRGYEDHKTRAEISCKGQSEEKIPNKPAPLPLRPAWRNGSRRGPTAGERLPAATCWAPRGPTAEEPGGASHLKSVCGNKKFKEKKNIKKLPRMIFEMFIQYRQR